MPLLEAVWWAMERRGEREVKVVEMVREQVEIQGVNENICIKKKM